MIKAGSINEPGFINNWNKQGFTFNKAGSELISNSIDAFSEDISFVIKEEDSQKCIDMIDNGIGMTIEKFPKMFDLSRENHASDKSMGVAGIGGFLSLYKASHDDTNTPTQVRVSTKHRDGPYLKAIIPFDQIFKTKQFNGMIEINEITDDTEIDEFNKDRANYEKTGTTIRFIISQNFYDLLTSQFVEKFEEVLNISCWWSVVFGKFKSNISFDKKDGKPPIILKKYDYFAGPSHYFYMTPTQYRIYYLKDDNRFVTLNPSDNFETYIEIPKDGRGFGIKPKPARVDMRKIENSDSFTLKMGMRKHDGIFNIKNPSSETVETATVYLNSYDESFMSLQNNKDKIKYFASKTPLIRNGQKITDFTINQSFSSSRAGGEAIAKGVYHRSEIEYEVYSSQENILDNIFNIQQNKNQNQNVLPIPLLRLIQYLKDFDYQKHTNYFKEVYDIKLQKLKRQRLERERLEKERLERERLEKERLERERLEKERLEKERLEKERLERERLEREQLERERLERERLEREHLEREQLEREQLKEEDEVSDSEDEEEVIQEVEKEYEEEDEEEDEEEEANEEDVQEVEKEVIQEVEKEESIQGTVQIEDFEEENTIILSEEKIEISLSLQYEREAISLITSQINNPLYKSKNGEELLNMIKKFYKI